MTRNFEQGPNRDRTNKEWLKVFLIKRQNILGFVKQISSKRKLFGAEADTLIEQGVKILRTINEITAGLSVKASLYPGLTDFATTLKECEQLEQNFRLYIHKQSEI